MPGIFPVCIEIGTDQCVLYKSWGKCRMQTIAAMIWVPMWSVLLKESAVLNAYRVDTGCSHIHKNMTTLSTSRKFPSISGGRLVLPGVQIGCLWVQEGWSLRSLICSNFFVQPQKVSSFGTHLLQELDVAARLWCRVIGWWHCAYVTPKWHILGIDVAPMTHWHGNYVAFMWHLRNHVILMWHLCGAYVGFKK